MQKYLDELHQIAWKHGDGNGRILLGTLSSQVMLKRRGENIVRPPRIRKMKTALLAYGQGQFVLDTQGTTVWVRSLVNKALAPNGRSVSSCSHGVSTHNEHSAETSNFSRKTFQIDDKKTTCHLIDDSHGFITVISRLDGYINATNGSLRVQSISDVHDDVFELPVIAMDCEGVHDDLQLFQIAIPDISCDGRILVFLIDCQRIGVGIVCEHLKPFLTTDRTIKLFHDVHNDARAIHTFSNGTSCDSSTSSSSEPSSLLMESVLDTQLLAEFLVNDPFIGFNALMSHLDLPKHQSKDFVHGRMRSGVDLWSHRPISQQALEYAAQDVSLLLNIIKKLPEVLEPVEFRRLLTASRQRVMNAIATMDDEFNSRSICFDIASDYRLASSELLQTVRPQDGFFGEPIRVHNDIDEVLDILPRRFKTKFVPNSLSGPVKDKHPDAISTMDDKNVARKSQGDDTIFNDETKDEELSSHGLAMEIDGLSDIVLDVERSPQCWIDDRRNFLCEDEGDVVTQGDLDNVCTHLGTFGSDNRAGLSGKLHRFSRMLDREGNITGITIRVGRHVDGNAAMLMDFLMSTDKSILILGEPGSGKTTVVREATRKLAEVKNVIVVDTSNEIAGDGMLPHPCIGLARRMMVPSLDKQSTVMIECVQNHTPHVMVIDEIGRPKEVQAARTVKQRGVRLIASAHGSLRMLLKNKDLNGLVGGTEHVMMGDAMAKEEAKRKQHLADNGSDGGPTSFSVSKTKVQRSSEPTFEVVIEVQRGSRHELRVIGDTARAVDQILDGLQFNAQLRTRDPTTGSMRLAFVHG